MGGHTKTRYINSNNSNPVYLVRKKTKWNTACSWNAKVCYNYGIIIFWISHIMNCISNIFK